MPRAYKRKTTRQGWSEAAMLKALDAVTEGMPYKTASRQFSVPLMSLKRRSTGKNKYAVDAVKVLGSLKPVFTPEQERELVSHIKDMESRMYGLTKQDVLSLAYQLAVKNNISHRFSDEKGKAGNEWLVGFRKRNPDITLRAPESTSSARARAFNKPVVDKFFATLKDIQEKHSFPPTRIYNVDETSICTVPTKNTKIFAETGRKQVARVTSAERGDTTTAVICTSASGNFIPPMFIFRRKRMKIELMDGAPPGSVYACNASGWMKLEVFSQWFNHFLAQVKPSKDDPVLLVLDGHLSHTKNLGVILKARENHVTILCLPPHCTHKLQPLDVGVMYPLSVYHNQSLEKYMNNNPGRVVTVFQIAKIFAEAYLKAAIPANSINGFSKCGIYPFNPDVFSDVDFIAAETTEMEDETTGMEVNSEVEETPALLSALSVTRCQENELNRLPATLSHCSQASGDGQRETSSPLLANACPPLSTESGHVTPPPRKSHEVCSIEAELSPSLLSNTQVSPVAEIITGADVFLSAPKNVGSDTEESLAPSVPHTPASTEQNLQRSSMILPSQGPLQPSVSPILFKNSTIDSQVLSQVNNQAIPSTSFGKFPPKSLIQLPKIIGKRRNGKTKTKKVHTSVLTSTPYKNQLEEETNRKATKEQKKAEKKEKSIKLPVNKNQSKGKRIVKGKKKAIKKRTCDFDSSEEENNTDTECIFCTEPYSKDRKGEGWIRCCICTRWGHEACAGVGDDDEEFICDFCLDDRYGHTKKQLDF